MSGDYTALAAIWATLPSSMTTVEKMMALNNIVAPGPARDVSRTAITGVLGPGTIATMQSYVKSSPTSQACLKATNYLLAVITYEADAVGDVLPTGTPANLAMVQTLGPDLLADPANGLTQPMMGQVMSLITPTTAWWKAHGFDGPILVSDLITAGNLF